MKQLEKHRRCDKDFTSGCAKGLEKLKIMYECYPYHTATETQTNFLNITFFCFSKDPSSQEAGVQEV